MNKPDVRSVLLRWAQAIPEQKVAVLLSSGIDSASVMFALLESGKTVTAYSFMLDGKLSTDFSLARRNAARFKCDFVPVFLPTDLDQLVADLRKLKKLGARKKTDFECGWPMLYAYRATREKVVASGMGADGHFCISKKGMIHFRERIDVFRRGLYQSPTYAQKPIHNALAAELGKTAAMPFLERAMQEEFLGTTWNEVNRPRQKEPILRAFPQQFEAIRILPHTNLQLGDSGIAEHFNGLLKSKLNTGAFKSVISIYNRL
jgi:asparagine synthetase B (glutamine-hydrolysing)